MNRSIAVLIAVALTFAAWAPLQSPAGEFKLKIVNPAPQTDDRFGRTLTAVGSSGNILVAAPASLVEGGSTGALYLMDGCNGDLLQTYRSPSANPANFGRVQVTWQPFPSPAACMRPGLVCSVLLQHGEHERDSSLIGGSGNGVGWCCHGYTVNCWKTYVVRLD